LNLLLFRAQGYQLLHVMQEKQLVKPGSGHGIDVDVRILAASDINIERALAGKKLREDLYYRLSAFTVHVPPLRQRKDELPFLLRHFMHKFARYYALPARQFSAAVLDACQRYSWPGNVRELESFVKRYLMIGDEASSLGGPDSAESTDNLPFSPIPYIGVSRELNDEFDQAASGNKSLKSLVQDVKSEAEQNAIAAALEKTGWNRKAAARLLKVSYRTMLYKIEQYHMKAPDPYASPLMTNGYRNGNGVKHNGKAS
jgi:DNA-binding NtrC family response regulator